jgi:hypothetical protein
MPFDVLKGNCWGDLQYLAFNVDDEVINIFYTALVVLGVHIETLRLEVGELCLHDMERNFLLELCALVAFEKLIEVCYLILG